MHANAIANGVVVSFLSKMLTHRKITPAAICLPQNRKPLL